MLEPRCRWSAILLLSACTPVDPPARSTPEPKIVQPEIETPPPAAVEAPPVTADNSLPWLWRSAQVAGQPERGLSMPTFRNGTTLIEVRSREAGGLEVVQTDDGKTEWTTTLPDRAAALAWAGDVVVAHYDPIASGTQVTRLHAETGATVWTTPLQGMGPIDHSRYRNDVQTQIAAGKIWVYGWESAGAYVEVLDLQDGHQLQHALVRPGLTELKWRPVAPPGREPRVSLPPAWTMAEGSPPVLHHAAGDDPAWSIPLPKSSGGCDTVAAVEHDGVLYLAHACSITSGARLYTLSIAERRWLKQTDLVGVGPIAHFAYFNVLDIEWRDDRVLVYGREAMGNYVEAVDPTSGITLATKRWPVR